MLSIDSISYTAGTNSRPSTPSTPSHYGAKTPGEIVTSALRNRSRPSGGLRKAIGMYQENRKQSLQVRRSLQENRCHSSFLEELEETSDKQHLLQPDKREERYSSSAGECALDLVDS